MTVPAPSSSHTCPWPGCRRAVPAHHLMCPADWRHLPADIRARVLAAYQPGQNALTCSPEYRAALRDALAYARASAESDQAAWGGRGPSASYAEWLTEGQATPSQDERP